MSVTSKNNNDTIDISISPNKRRHSKKRRRLMISHYIAAANVVILGLVFLAGFIYLLFLDRETVSNEENRTLTKFPKFSISSYFSGEFTEGVADYYDDTVHNRSEIKNFIASTLLPLKGRQYGDDEITIYGSGFENLDEIQNETQAPTEPASTQPAATTDPKNTGTTTAASEVNTTTTTTVTTLPDNKNEAADGEIANNIVVANNRGLMLYGGGKANGIEYASFLNAYKRDLGEDVNVYSMVCPTSVSYYMPENYLDLTASEKDNIDNINSALDGVIPVNIYDALLLHKDEAIYSRTDHHWQPLGAYYAAEEFARTAGVTFADLSEYETVTLPGYVGTLYGFTNSSALINNPEDFVYYIPSMNTTTTRYSTSFTDPREEYLLLDPAPMSSSNYYMVFGGDGQITHVNTDCKNNRTLVIFKDSYGNALLPMLTSSFEDIYLCDIRYFYLNAISFIQQVEATDVLFAMNTFSATGSNYKHIESNRTK